MLFFYFSLTIINSILSQKKSALILNLCPMTSRHCIGWRMNGGIEDRKGNPTTEDYSHDPSTYEFEEELPVHILQIIKILSNESS